MNGEDLSGIRIVLLSGEEFQRLERMSEILKGAVDPATRDFNLDIIRPEDFSPDNLSELVMTFPMMAERRVIVLRDFDKLRKDQIKTASESILQTPETSLVIIEGEKAALSPKPKKFFAAESFKTIYENKLPSWIRGRFTQRGKRISEAAIAHIINNVGTVLGELDSEIEKVTIISGDSEQISDEDVRHVVGAFKRDTIYGLCNAVGRNDFCEASRILANLMANEKNKETVYISQLSKHIMQISEYNRLRRNNVPHGEALKVATTPFLWNLNQMSGQVRNFSPARVKRTLTILGRTESALKRSSIDNRLLMEFLLPLIITESSKA